MIGYYITFTETVHFYSLVLCLYILCLQGPGWLNELGSWIT